MITRLSRFLHRSPNIHASKSFLLKQPHTVSIIGAPLSHGQPLQGVDEGPQILRRAGLRQRLEKDAWNIEDKGDLAFELFETELTSKPRVGNVKFAKAVGAATAKIAKAVYAEAQKENFVLTLGGDHSMAIGSISGILQAQPSTGIIWVDAHADLNSPDSSSSGNIHGMVLSYLFNLNNTRSLPGFEWMKPVPELQLSRLVYVGLRDIDPPERRMIKEMGIKTFTMQDIDRWGIGKVMELALDHLTPRSSYPRPIHLSFDIDSVDPTYAPATGTRVAGGLSYREAYYIAEAIAETGLLKSMDLAEVNPKLGNNPENDAFITAELGVGIITSALGNTIL